LKEAKRSQRGCNIRDVTSDEISAAAGPGKSSDRGRPFDDDPNVDVDDVDTSEIEWLSTQEAARRLGITPRTLYRFIDHGELPAYRFGRVIRLRAHEVDAFIESSRIKPGELEHLYPEPVTREDS
jgi:excisionase family DNA binding protein